MITIFERIPDQFVELYDYQFRVWAEEFQSRPRRCAIVFVRPPGQEPARDAEGRQIVAGAWLEAEVDRAGPAPRVIIRPASEHDEEMIARHCREMRGTVLQ